MSPTMQNSPTPAALWLCTLLLLQISAPPAALGNGLDRNGTGAKSMGMAGASLADDKDAVSSMGQNPAALGFLEAADLNATIAGAWGSGRFQNSVKRGGELVDAKALFPELVFRTPLTEGVGMGFSLIPEYSRVADWYFRDPEGGIDGGTSYGWQHHRSEIINVRAAVGLGVRVSDSFSLGGSVGMVYTRNRLATPYIFQSHPALAGFKTMLDMETEGFGFNGDLAADWRATEKLTIALSYRSPTKFDTDGEAKGDITKQLRSLGLNVPGGFRYNADIATELPQKAALGFSYKAAPRLRLAGQVEWINWSRAFHDLDVRLSNGSNPAINGLLGTNTLQDSIALDWEDRFVYRAGVEYDVTQQFVLRTGYAYGKSPIPSDTLLPMTAAISEHTLALGVGYKQGPYQVDLAYQYDLPASQAGSGRSITGSEYKGSSVDLEAHWLALTLGLQF